MTARPAPKILDLTLSEGAFALGHQVSLALVKELALELDRAKIEFAEFSHGCGIGSRRKGFPGLNHDLDLLKAARSAAPKLKRSIYIEAQPASLTELELVRDNFEIARIGANADRIEACRDQVNRVKSYRKTALIQLLRVHRLEPARVAEAVAAAKGMGADGVILSDSYGSMGPEDVAAYFEAARQATPLALGFYGRNNTERAAGNAWAAYQSGAEWFCASLLGLGRDSGILNLEVLVSLFHRHGIDTGINPQELHNAVTWGVLPNFGNRIAPSYAELLFAKHRIEIYPKEFIGILSNILDWPEETFVEKAIELSPESLEIGEPEVRQLLASEGLNFEVVMEYIQTGKIPGAGDASRP